MLEDYLISMGTTILLLSIKNPEKRAKMKKIAKKIFDSILAAYPEFLPEPESDE
jgi:hypothetical protein